MTKPQVELQEEENIAQSRILFEEVMVDNEPTQEQVFERAQELQIDDLSLARQSLTKELEPYWRPYMNRFGDIYYVNLKERKAYVEHPIDMETKILYAKRRRNPVPKYRAFELQDISGSVNLIEQEIRKWKKADLLKSTQSIPTQLNIVYEQSEQSNTERQKSQNYESSDEQYIQNLQKFQQENTRSRKSTPRQDKESFNRGYKKFPSTGNNDSNTNYLQENQDEDIELTPEYERMLLEYEEQLKKEHQKQLQFYRELKQDNYMKKQDILRQSQKAYQDQIKFQVLAEFQAEIEEKNSHNLEKQTHKMVMEYKNKLETFQKAIEKQRLVLENLQELTNSKHEFIQLLEDKMQLRINKGKYVMQQNLGKELYKTHFLSKITEQNQKYQEIFSRDSNKIIESKLNQLIQKKGLRTRKGERVFAGSLTTFYENIVKEEFRKIDKLLQENQVERETRRRTKSIFGNNKKPVQFEEYESHIVFAQTQRSIKENKENSMNIENMEIKEKKYTTTERIENDIMKSSQINRDFYERKSRIFGAHSKEIVEKVENNKNQRKKQRQKEGDSKDQEVNYNSKFDLNQFSFKGDRKSMYLRMWKRIL